MKMELIPGLEAIGDQIDLLRWEINALTTIQNQQKQEQERRTRLLIRMSCDHEIELQLRKK